MLSASSRPAGVTGDAPPRTTSSAYCANGARNREASSASTRADSLPSTRAAVSSTRSTPIAWGASTASAPAQHTRTRPRRRTTASAVSIRQVSGCPIKTGSRPGVPLDLGLTLGVELGGMNGHTPRRATSADNTGLLALAAACPMRAGLTLCVRREPDFFALNRLQGDRWDVGVVDGDRAGVIGCIATAERLAYVNGTPAATAYVSDLKVHPAFRGRRNGTGSVADALTEYARDTLGATDPHMPVLITVLGGNAAIAPRLPGPGGLPRFSRFATIRTFAVPLFILRRLGPPPKGLSVRPAEERDLDEMAALWRAVAPLRQLAPVLCADHFRRLCTDAPGLSLSSYWIARHASGRLAGFVALWDQHRLKNTVVQRYSTRAALFRYG